MPPSTFAGEKSIQDDAFATPVALNVWKSSAIAAGSFDKKLYEELRNSSTTNP
jgi:hypothetical protein